MRHSLAGTVLLTGPTARDVAPVRIGNFAYQGGGTQAIHHKWKKAQTVPLRGNVGAGI